MSKIAVLLNTSWNAVNFRRGLLESLIKSEYDVVVIAPDREFEQDILAMGAKFHMVVMRPQSKNIISELKCVWSVWRVMVALRPDVLLTFTIKPNLYGGFVARMTRTPYIINIAGLGSSFSRKSTLEAAVSLAYRVVTRRAKRVFVQNQEDASLLRRRKMCPEQLIDVLPGSGVDLTYYSPEPLPQSDSTRYIFVGRLLLQKGIKEYLSAAERITTERSDVEFYVLGFLEQGNPAYIDRLDLDGVCAGSEKIIYLGAAADVRKYLAASHCVVLPSYYREGTPRTLLEAAAMARPIITTNSVGCRDTVVHESTGILCDARSVDSLAEAMRWVADCVPGKLSQMGRFGRTRTEVLYDERLVLKKYHQALTSCQGDRMPKC